jgi:ESCRT-II complex subunit VPS22
VLPHFLLELKSWLSESLVDYFFLRTVFRFPDLIVSPLNSLSRSFSICRYAQKKADEMKAISFQTALDTVEKLEVKLTEFAEQHSAQIQNDPVFRQKFLQMCAPLGVDPLASKKSFWGKLLGMGDFYHELAVKVAEVCLAAKSRNGGIMSVTEVQSILAKRKTRLGSAGNSRTNQVSAADIQVAIQKLAKLGGGFRTVTVGSSTMIISVPTELDNDHMEVLTVAQNNPMTGITVDHVEQATGWNRDRIERALELLLQQGMAWLDEYRGESYYWFPSVWQEGMEGFS